MYRPHFLLAIISAIGRFFSRRPTGPGPQMFMEEPPIYRHGSSSRYTRLPMTKYRRWRRGRMRMQGESRRRNRC